MDKERFPNKKAVEGQKADLTSTNMRFAILTDANLSGANLTGVDLNGANLTNAKGLDN